MRPASEGPKEGETVRPRDCHLVNVSFFLTSVIFVWKEKLISTGFVDGVREVGD